MGTRPNSKALYRLQKNGNGDLYAEEWTGEKWVLFLRLKYCTSEDEAIRRIHKKVQKRHVETLTYLDKDGRELLDDK